MSEQDPFGLMDVDEGDFSLYVTDEEGNVTVILEASGDEWSEVYSREIVKRFNACAGMSDPAAEIAAKDARIEELVRRANIDWDRNSALTDEVKKLRNDWLTECVAKDARIKAQREEIVQLRNVRNGAQLGESILKGKLAQRDARIAELESALAASKAREGEAERLLKRGLCVWPDAESAYDQIKWEDDARAFLKERQ